MSAIAFKLPKLIETELGVEKLCIHCGEYWPLDSEFWWCQNVKGKDGVVTPRFEAACKGCYVERYKPKRLTERSPRKIKGAVECC